MTNPEYLFDKYEEEAQALRNKIQALKGSVGAWKYIANLLMSDDPAEREFGKSIYEGTSKPK